MRHVARDFFCRWYVTYTGAFKTILECFRRAAAIWVLDCTISHTGFETGQLVNKNVRLIFLVSHGVFRARLVGH